VADRPAVYWTRHPPCPYDPDSMLAIIGNVVAAVLAASLFTATLRLSK
jgi:hypothetical protein